MHILRRILVYLSFKLNKGKIQATYNLNAQA